MLNFRHLPAIGMKSGAGTGYLKSRIRAMDLRGPQAYTWWKLKSSFTAQTNASQGFKFAVNIGFKQVRLLVIANE
jgi:hypothetical protein